MVSTGRHAVQREAVRAMAGNVGGIILRAVNAVMDLETMPAPPAALAALGGTRTDGTVNGTVNGGTANAGTVNGGAVNGGAASTAETTRRNQRTAAVRALLGLLREINDLVTWGVDPTGGRPLWSDSAAVQVARWAAADTGAIGGQPGAVRTVLGYLAKAGLLRADPNVPTGIPAGIPTHSAKDFAYWLDSDPDNQARLGVIATYSGPARNFTDVPGGIRDGDLVVIDPGSAVGNRSTLLGVAGNGNLYNKGLLKPNFGGLANLRVYRPTNIGMA